MNLLDSKKVIICMGSGGVGKTTVSAALAVAAAAKGKAVLVLTIDPSLRLASAFGLDGWKGEEILVDHFSGHGKLYAAMINPKQIFDDFLAHSGADPKDLELILNNAFYKELSTSLSGTQEFTSLQALSRAHLNKKYDLVILDTPPAEHTLEFLESPQHIYDLFSGSVVDWFSQVGIKRSALFGILNKGTLMAFKIFEKITGSQFLKEMEIFFTLISKLRQHVKATSNQVRSILGSSQTAFILVTRFDYNKISESLRISEDLKARGFMLSKIVMNGALPRVNVETLSGTEKVFFEKIKNFIDFQSRHFKNLQNQWDQRVGVKTLPMIEYSEDEAIMLKKLANEFNHDF